jgi:hypothetical protein
MRKYLQSFTLLGLLGLFIIRSANADEFKQYADASLEFNQLVAKTAAQHKMPRLSDPVATKLITTMSDHRRFLNAHDFSVPVLGELMDMCQTATRVSVSYLLFDLDKHIDKAIQNPIDITRRTIDVAARNAVTYQDEITPVLSFQYRCLAKVVPLLNTFFATLKPEEFTSIRRDGLIQARRGVFTSFVGVVQTSTEAAISLHNRRLMFNVMAEVTPFYSQILDLPARKQILEHLNSRAGSIPSEFSDQYQQVVKDLGSSTCEALCRL